ncbi:hypothetical protein ScPMuIL_000021 [Solemya velum]
MEGRNELAKSGYQVTAEPEFAATTLLNGKNDDPDNPDHIPTVKRECACRSDKSHGYSITINRMKFFTGSTIFSYAWDQVAIGFWQRYPNPNSKHVLTEDVLSREVIGNKLITRRLLTKTNPVPRWGERIVGGKQRCVCIVEESVVDLDKKTLTTYTRNVGMQRMMSIEEKCIYEVNPDNSKFTSCQKMAWIESSLYGFSRAITAFGFERFKKNTAKAFKGFEHVLEKLYPSETQIVEQVPLSACSKGKLKDKARKAKEIAKEKATRSILNSGQVS